jgi:hypothetical protein
MQVIFVWVICGQIVNNLLLFQEKMDFRLERKSASKNGRKLIKIWSSMSRKKGKNRGKGEPQHVVVHLIWPFAMKLVG